MTACPACDGDGYLERFNHDQSDVITELCVYCAGLGEIDRDQPFLVDCDPGDETP